MANNLDNFVPEIWSRNIVRNIDQVNLAMAVCANTDYEGEIRAAGDTVHVRTYGNITVQDYVRGQTISTEDLTPVKETLVVDKSKMFAFKVDDLDTAQNDLSAIQGYTGRAGVSMANHMDSYIFSLHTLANSSNELSNGGSAYNIATTDVYERIVAAGLSLDEQNVEQAQRWMIVSPYMKSLLLKDTTYFIKGSVLGDTVLTTANFAGGQPMTAAQAAARGFLGQIAGFDVYVSTNLPTSGANKFVLYGQGKPISFAAQIQPGSVEAIRLETTFATQVRGLVLYGGQVFAEDAKRLGTILIDNS